MVRNKVLPLSFNLSTSLVSYRWMFSGKNFKSVWNQPFLICNLQGFTVFEEVFTELMIMRSLYLAFILKHMETSQVENCPSVTHCRTKAHMESVTKPCASRLITVTKRANCENARVIPVWEMNQFLVNLRCPPWSYHLSNFLISYSIIIEIIHVYTIIILNFYFSVKQSGWYY